MTLEETTERIVAAAEAADLALLQDAIRKRGEAITLLPSILPTPKLRDAVAASLAAGEEARRAIRAIQQRLRKESRKLTNIENGFLRALRPDGVQRIDCKG